MSEEASESVMPGAEEAPAKKKSKLPIILILVLVLGGGGFFATKLRGGKPKPEIRLSKEKPAELKEFLINLKTKDVYCRTEVAIGLAEGTNPKLIEEHEAAVRDAINMCLMSKELTDVNTFDGIAKLKREMAADLNKVLAEPKDDKKGDDSADAADASADPKTDPKADPAKPAPPQHPEWDSDTGPVLKIYFSSFATQ
ncbi:MAG TPA: flagellar basal body-associated FliL family protein [Fimbriimonadaceae bacterium]|nr:flagellar basal body-associated FliL family protein [Fimbriimonadaceae bacterium]